MSVTRITINSATAIGLAGAAITLAGPAMAQQYDPAPVTSEEVSALPADMQQAPAPTDYTETSVGPDGVETVVRTRRIERQYEAAPAYRQDYGYAPPAYSPAPAVFKREQWLDECERRTSGRSESEKGGIIGGLLGAVAGGIIGNRVAGSGDRLAGTLIGAGTGGLGGALLGGLVGGGKKNDKYDCEAALDGYLAQYGSGPSNYAPGAYAGYAPRSHYGYAYPQTYGYGYGPQQQIVYVPVRYEQPQRVIVRETVREEFYEEPGSAQAAN